MTDYELSGHLMIGQNNGKRLFLLDFQLAKCLKYLRKVCADEISSWFIASERPGLVVKEPRGGPGVFGSLMGDTRAPGAHPAFDIVSGYLSGAGLSYNCSISCTFSWCCALLEIRHWSGWTLGLIQYGNYVFTAFSGSARRSVSSKGVGVWCCKRAWESQAMAFPPSPLLCCWCFPSVISRNRYCRSLGWFHYADNPRALPRDGLGGDMPLKQCPPLLISCLNRFSRCSLPAAAYLQPSCNGIRGQLCF